MRFGFFFDYDHTYTLVKLFKSLARRMPSATASGFVLNDRYLGYARENLPPGTTLISFYSLLAPARRYTPTAEELAEFKIFDERHNLARVAFSERHLADWDYDELIPHYIHLIKAFRHYVETERPDVFIFDAVASQHSHLLYLVLRDAGVRVLMPFGFGVEDLYYVADNPYFQCPEIWALYRHMREGRAAPTAEERAWAAKFMNRVRSGAGAYDNQAVALERRKFSLPNVRRVFDYARNYWRYDRHDPSQRDPFSRVWAVAKLRFNRIIARRYFSDPNTLDDGFLLFALHFEPEIATLILSQVEQLSVIDIIARQLPLSRRLVLKEHPAMLGQRGWRFYRDVRRRYPNIVFVASGATVAQLARRSQALMTLNGTAILEAMILGTPVIYISRARFGGFDLGSFSTDFFNFAQVCAKARDNAPDEEALIAMLSSIRRLCHRFEFMEPLGNPRTIADDNIEAIAGAFMERLAVTAA
jgi:hypothetical protein